MSLDYSDFNKEHSLAELALIDLAFSEAWEMYGRFSECKFDKSLASLKLAQHDYYSRMNWSSQQFPCSSGMFSGTRTTMRDNTVLNYAYSMLSLEIANQRSEVCNAVR